METGVSTNLSEGQLLTQTDPEEENFEMTTESKFERLQELQEEVFEMVIVPTADNSKNDMIDK